VLDNTCNITRSKRRYWLGSTVGGDGLHSFIK